MILVAIFGRVVALVVFIWVWMFFLLAYFSVVELWKPIAILAALAIYRWWRQNNNQRSSHG